MSAFDRVQGFLREHGVAVEFIGARFDKAEVNSRPGVVGVKSLVVKGSGGRRLLAIPGSAPMDSRAVRHALGWRKMRFLTPERLHELTGLVPGAVPPIGAPLWELELLADERLQEAEVVFCGAGNPEVHMLMSGADWRRVARPSFASFVARA